MRLGIEGNRGDKNRQNRVPRVTGRDNPRAHLDDEPRDYCTAERDAINFSAPQFLEEVAHDVGDPNLIIIWCGVSDRQMSVQKRSARSISTQTMISQRRVGFRNMKLSRVPISLTYV